MAQISRPIQIVFLVFALFVATWFIALRGHSSSTSGSVTSLAPATTTPTPTPAASGNGGKAIVTHSKIYHGSAPGVEGLSRAIAKAHGAVSASQHNAHELEGKSSQAAGEAQSAPSAAKAPAHPSSSSSKAAPSSTAAAPEVATKSHASSPSKAVTTPAPKTHTPAGKATETHSFAQQKAVEAELGKGDVVLVLFWNPKGSDDVLVHHELKALAAKSGKHIAVQFASASQVANFGSITKGVQVFGTPTLLIVNKHGQANTLTGFTDVYAIKQAIAEISSSS